MRRRTSHTGCDPRGFRRVNLRAIGDRLRPELKLPARREKTCTMTYVTRPDGSQQVLGYDWTARAAAQRLVEQRDVYYPWVVSQFEVR